MDRRRRRERLATWIALAALCLLLLVPTPGIGVFDGLPLDHWPEFAAFCLVLPALFWPRLREGYRSALGPGSRRLPALVVAAAVAVAILARVLMAVGGHHAGLAGCYRSTLIPPRTGACELSFDNSFRVGGVTRYDNELHFIDTNSWRLGFFNDDRFDYRPLVAGMPARDHLPFQVHWAGVVDSPGATDLDIQYVGEGSLRFGDRLVVLPPRYGTDFGEVKVQLPAGRLPLTADYRFDDNFGLALHTYSFREAALIVNERSHGHPELSWQPLRAAGPAGLDSLMAWLETLTVLALLAPLLIAYWRLSRWGVLAAGALMLIGSTAFLYTVDPVARGWLLEQTPRFRSLDPSFAIDLLFMVPLIALTLACALVPRGALVAGWLGACALAAWNALALPGPAIRLRSYGDDHLRYESFAREILATWRPLAGEYVFQYAPLYRYVKFVEHLLFGDVDVVYSGFALALLYFIPVWLLSRMRPAAGRPPLGIAVAAAALLAGLLASPMVTSVVNDGLSEYPAWAGLLLAIGLLGGASPPRPVLAAICLAVAVGVRANFIFGAALIVLLAAPSVTRMPARRWLPAVGVGIAISLLPLAHNLYYGGEFAPFTTLHNAVANQALTAAQLARLPFDGAVRAVLAEQLRYLFVRPPITTSWVTADRLIWVVQQGFVLAVAVLGFLALRRAPRIPGGWRRGALALAPLALPLVLLAVQAVYIVVIYYPRQIVVVYLAAPAVVIWTAERAARLARPARSE